jgi:hypothetical protein
VGRTGRGHYYFLMAISKEMLVLALFLGQKLPFCKIFATLQLKRKFIVKGQ